MSVVMQGRKWVEEGENGHFFTTCPKVQVQLLRTNSKKVRVPLEFYTRKDVVQISQGVVAADQEPSPDGRLAAFQRDLDLKDRCV